MLRRIICTSQAKMESLDLDMPLMDIPPMLTRRNSSRKTDKKFSLNSRKRRRRPRKNLMILT